jgi:hypothetical protein
MAWRCCESLSKDPQHFAPNPGHCSMGKRYAQLKPCLENGRERIRFPVIVKIAFAHRRQHWRKSWLAQSSRRVIGLQEMHVDIRRSLREAHRRIFVEITLNGATALDGDFVSYHVTQSFNHRALAFLLNGTGMNDLACHVTHDPTLFTLILFWERTRTSTTSAKWLR